MIVFHWLGSMWDLIRGRREPAIMHDEIIHGIIPDNPPRRRPRRQR
jgi:hypothetical protein